MKNKTKIFYWIALGLLSLMLLGSAGMYLFSYEDVKVTFSSLGFPSYVIYPLAIAKILGLIAIWSRKNKTLVEWAFAGFFFNFLLAISAHLVINDGDWMGAAMALVLLFVAYYFDRKLYIR